MGFYIPFSIPGALDPWEDVDNYAGFIGTAGSIIRVWMAVTEVPVGGNFTCEIRNSSSGGGDGITGTIPESNKLGGNFSDSITLTGSQYIYVRVKTAFGAMNLQGWLEYTTTGVASISAALTDLATVKTDHGITGSDNDAQLTRIIAGVSKAMQNWMGRAIVDTSYTDEIHSGNGWQDTLALNHRPVTSTDSFVVKLDDVEVSNTLYTKDDDAGLLYLISGQWTRGSRNYKVSYSAGYTSVPDDLVMAATIQCRHEFNQSQPSATNRVGIHSNADATGGSTVYVPGGFLPEVLEIMRPYRRVV